MFEKLPDGWVRLQKKYRQRDDQSAGLSLAGNIRVLENVHEWAVINSSGPKLNIFDELNHLPRHEPGKFQTLAAVERDHIIRVLADPMESKRRKQRCLDPRG